MKEEGGRRKEDEGLVGNLHRFRRLPRSGWTLAALQRSDTASLTNLILWLITGNAPSNALGLPPLFAKMNISSPLSCWMRLYLAFICRTTEFIALY